MSVLAGAVAPERLRIDVTNAALASEPLDLTTVTAAALRVLGPSGQWVIWAATIVSKTASAILLEHVFAQGDVDSAGKYSIQIQLTVPSGTRRAGPTSLSVT